MSAGTPSRCKTRLGELSDAHALAAARRCTPRPACPRSSERKIGVHHVVDVQEVAHGVAVADRRAARPSPRECAARAPRATAAGSSAPARRPEWLKLRVQIDAHALRSRYAWSAATSCAAFEAAYERERPLLRRPRAAASRRRRAGRTAPTSRRRAPTGSRRPAAPPRAPARRAGARCRRCSPRTRAPDCAARRARG